MIVFLKIRLNDFGVGIYNKDRESFSFSNGSYSPMELYKKPVGSSATYVISATPLQETVDNIDFEAVIAVVNKLKK